MEIEVGMLVVNRQDDTFGIVTKRKEAGECVVQCLDPHGSVRLHCAQLVPIRRLDGKFLMMPLEEILEELK